MPTNKAITYAVVMLVAVAALSMISINLVEKDTNGIKQVVAQSNLLPSAAPFAPGQVIYLSDAVINRQLEIPAPFPPPSQSPPPFSDMKNGNAARSVIVPYLAAWMHQEVTPHFSDPTLSFRYVTLALNAGYDATAPYDETSVGVYSRIENRPPAEYEDYENMNIASLHAAYQLFMKFDPSREQQWRTMLTNNGLDPDNRDGLNLDCFQEQKHELTSPIAIGNLAGKCVWEGRVNDGFNHSGEETNGYPFMDTTGYTPVNSANVLVDPSRWQPLIIRMGESEYVTQQFVTPQWANTQPYADFDPRLIRADVPEKSNHLNEAAYKEQADEVLAAVAGLDDRQKIIAEYFDNKARGTIFSPPLKQIESPKDFWQLDFLLHFAEFDAGIVAWQEKARHDAVRPITAIKYIYGEAHVQTYDDKNPDTPRMIPASQWRPYLDTSDHPEYPSATACFCAAEAQAWKRFIQDGHKIPSGIDEIPSDRDAIPTVNGELGFSGELRQGSSIREVGITPANNVEISYATWTEYVRDCADSRVWTGVHFQDAVDESIEICADVGNKAYDYFETLLDGTAPARGPDQKLSSDLGVDTRVSDLLICR